VDVRLGVESLHPEERRIQQVAVQGLADELRRSGIAAEPTPVETPPGAKSTGVNGLGELVVSGVLSGATVTALARIVTAYINRRSAQRISIEIGDRRLEIVGSSGDEQRLALEAFLGEATRQPDE
jgi:hypothetical protein